MSDTPNADKMIEKKLKEEFADWKSPKPGLYNAMEKTLNSKDTMVMGLWIEKQFPGIVIAQLKHKGKGVVALYRYAQGGAMKLLKKANMKRGAGLDDILQWGGYHAFDFE